MNMEEQMNMVEILSEELGEKELKIMDLENELKKFMKKGLVELLKTSYSETHFMFNEKGYPIWDDDGQFHTWEEIVKEMNDDDWNKDEKYCELFINQFNVINIRYRECRECNINSAIHGDDLILCPTCENYYLCAVCHQRLFQSYSSESESDSDSE
jgi:hypothetical protein